MKSKIKFVRTFAAWNSEWYDVVYESGRIYGGVLADAPRTVKNFIVTAKSKREQYDKVFKRTETIYE